MSPTTKTTVTLASGKTVKVVLAADMPTPETEVLRKAAQFAGKIATETAFAHGLPITVGQDEDIVRIYPDGKREVIGKLPRR